MNNYDFDQIAVEMKGITQKFGSLVANDNIDLTVHKGEVHALLGENGAGKTTLVNSLYGLYHPTSGDIFINGEKVVMDTPNVAIQHGIGMVHQHFMLIKPFTVVENIILGMETHKYGVLDMAKATRDVMELSERYGLAIDPTSCIQDITVGMQQRVEILKALYRGADILILDDEPVVGQRLKPALEKEGHRVEIFVNPYRALERVSEKEFDIVVTDIRMEDIDGIQILERVRTLSERTKVVMITGYATIEVARESLAKGAFDFIAKPFKPDDLRKVIAKAAEALGSPLDFNAPVH